MAQLFGGYAQNRGFKGNSPVTRAKAIQSRSEDFLRNLKLQRDMEKQNAVQAHSLLQEQFKLDQNNRQQFQQLESAAAGAEREAKQQQYNNEIERINQQSKDKIAMYEALSGVSNTAAELIKQEGIKQKKAKIEFGQSLIMDYGLTPQEIDQIQTMESGLLQYEAEQAPLIHRLRSQGMPETDLNTLLKSSGWVQYGAALGAVQNANQDYDVYLAANKNKPVIINGQEMTLEDAELKADVDAISGIFNRLRSNFIEEYLPGYDPAFVAKYARKGMQVAESRYKRSIASNIEEQAEEENTMLARRSIALVANDDLGNPASFMEGTYLESGGIGSEILPSVHKQRVEHLAELTKSGAIDSSYARGVLKTPVFHKGFNEERPYEEVFPDQKGILLEAIQEQEEERDRVDDIFRNKQKRQNEAKLVQVENFYLNNPDQINENNILRTIKEFTSVGVNASRLSNLLKHSTSATNDREFDIQWNDKKVGGMFPTRKDVLFGRLSPQKQLAELKAIEAHVQSGFAGDIVSTAKKDIANKLRTKLGKEYGTTSRSLPGTFGQAEAHALAYVRTQFGAKFNNNNHQEALEYALAQLDKKIADPDGDYTVQSFDPLNPMVFEKGFKKWMGGQPKVSHPIDEIKKDLNQNTQSYREKLWVDAAQMKDLVNNMNAGQPITMPRQITLASQLLNEKVSPSEILLEQHRLAQQQDPTIADFRPEVMQRIKPAEQLFPEEVLRMIHRDPGNPNPVNRGLVQIGAPPMFDRSQPYVSLYGLLAPYNLRPEMMVKFGAITAGESDFRPRIDTVESGSDPFMENEFSVGLLQVNTQQHMDKLRRKGYTIEDLRNPIKNIEIAMDVWEEWIARLMNLDPNMTREEAEESALDRWGAYGHASKGNKGRGPYLDHMQEARDAFERWTRDQTLPTWEQSSHMNPTAQRWIDNNGGYWAA